jgi:hypothetical protein
MNSGIEADKVARDFTASVGSAYRLLASKFTLSELSCRLLGLHNLLKYKKKNCGKKPWIQHVNRHHCM